MRRQPARKEESELGIKLIRYPKIDKLPKRGPCRTQSTNCQDYRPRGNERGKGKKKLLTEKVIVRSIILHCPVVLFLIQLSWYVPQVQRTYIQIEPISPLREENTINKER